MLLLGSELPQDMDSQALVIRIRVPDGGAVDWTVQPATQLLFRDILDVIGQVLPDATTTAFEYEDEDGDRITVRSDEEMKAMLSYYCSMVLEQQGSSPLVEPLQIYPRACKPPGKRNIHGLKVNTRAGSSNNCNSSISDTMPSSSLKTSPAELKKILVNGQINELDIQNRDILGHGNGGTVYKAYHVSSGKILAVKVIPLDITVELQRQIMSELEILYKCDSPYIIGFYGAFFAENRISICTEFMDGGSLDVYRKIPEQVLGRISVAVLKGLTYLWSLKILHRDVKPSNMLVNTRGGVKLCDFGVSIQLVNSIAKTYVGTNAYMAVQNDLEHLKKKLANSNQQNGAMVDIQTLETAIQRTEHGIKKHTQDYLAYISCNPMTILHEQSKDKYTPRALKWGPQLEPAKQNQTLLLSNIPGTRRQPLSTTGHISPGQKHKQAISTRIMCNPEKPSHRDLLDQDYGVNLPLINCKPKASVPMEKIVRGPTIGHLSVLPASHRMDASLTPPPVHEKDVQKGILSLLQRGLIPSAARLTLVPPAIQPQTLALRSVQSRWTASNSQGKGRAKLSEEDSHQANRGRLESRLSSNGTETPFSSARHNVSNQSARTSAKVTNQERGSPVSQDPWELAAFSAPIGQSFTIYNGVMDPEAADFLAFKQHYCLSWGSFMTFLQSLLRLLQDYAVPAAAVSGERMKVAALDVELGNSPSISQLLSVLENRSSVLTFLNQPGRRYKGSEGRSAAALKIQTAWRGYKDRVAYLAHHRQRWAAGVLAIAWLLYVQKSRVHKMLLESRDHHLRNFRSRTEHLASNWNHIRTCRRSIIHIPSLGYTEKQRAQATDLHLEQNIQMGRLGDIADPNVDVIYVSPVKMDEETAQYFRSLLGLRTAVLSGNPQDAAELHQRFTIITPEAVDTFPNHHMCLSTLLKYSPKALQRIRNLIRGREAYIVGRVPHVDDLAVADMLGVPILGTEPEVAHLYSTKSGSKRIFASADIPIPPGQHDIYTEEQFLGALGQLIADNLLVTRWLFKVDNEFGSNGTAFCDIGVHLPCYSWALRESEKYGPDTWKQKWAQEIVLRRITEELPQVLEQYAQPVNRRRYPTWGRFLQTLISNGGVIEAHPPAESVTCLTVDLLIHPGGEIQTVSCGDQIHGSSPLRCVGSSVPQCSVPPSVLSSICNRVGEACKIRGVIGYLSVELITFIDPQSLQQEIWATDLDLSYSDQLAMTQLLLYLTNGMLDCTNSQLIVPMAKKIERSKHRAPTAENPLLCSRVAVLSTRLVHTNLSLVYYNVFFQMCKAHGIGFDVKEKQGTVFVLLENLKRHRIGMLSIGEDLQGALMTFARNLFIIHQEISAPKMRGETNFKDCVQEIEAILGVTEENKLLFEQ